MKNMCLRKWNNESSRTLGKARDVVRVTIETLASKARLREVQGWRLPTNESPLQPWITWLPELLVRGLTFLE